MISKLRISQIPQAQVMTYLPMRGTLLSQVADWTVR